MDKRVVTGDYDDGELKWAVTGDYDGGELQWAVVKYCLVALLEIDRCTYTYMYIY